MSNIDTKVVRMLLEVGRAKDLADLMEGESKYCTESKENIPKTEDELITYKMALEHVLFVAKFGNKIEKIKEGKHFYSAYPDDFDRWLEMGCLGITNSDLTAYLNDNPLVGQ